MLRDGGRVRSLRGRGLLLRRLWSVLFRGGLWRNAWRLGNIHCALRCWERSLDLVFGYVYIVRTLRGSNCVLSKRLLAFGILSFAFATVSFFYLTIFLPPCSTTTISREEQSFGLVMSHYVLLQQNHTAVVSDPRRVHME
jgi:hypothetical protein